MVSQVKRFGLVATAICIVWFSLQQNGSFSTTDQSVLAQGETSPLEQSGTQADGTPFPTVTPTLTGTPTLTPTSTITPTATPTPGNIAQIEFPSHGSVMFGFTTIRGTALINQYRKYDIHIAAAGSEDWQWLTTSYRIVRGGDLYTFDTTKVPDGYYDIRLRAIQDGGGFNETFCRGVEIRNEHPPTPTPALDANGALISPLTQPTPAPTATLDTRVRIPGAQGFYEPAEGSVIRGYTPIEATVNNLGFNFFERYELFISRTGLEEWSQLISSTEQHWQEAIYVLNTSVWANGFYDLRLRVVYQDSNYSEYHLRRLQIDNHDELKTSPMLMANGIHRPYSGQRVNGTVEFVGTAVDPNFLRWELYWSPGGQDAWTFLVQDNAPMVSGILARLDLSQLPADAYDFRLRVVRIDYNYNEYFARNVHLQN